MGPVEAVEAVRLPASRRSTGRPVEPPELEQPDWKAALRSQPAPTMPTRELRLQELAEGQAGWAWAG